LFGCSHEPISHIIVTQITSKFIFMLTSLLKGFIRVSKHSGLSLTTGMNGLRTGAMEIPDFDYWSFIIYGCEKCASARARRCAKNPQQKELARTGARCILILYSPQLPPLWNANFRQTNLETLVHSRLAKRVTIFHFASSTTSRNSISLSRHRSHVEVVQRDETMK
jgi:hypothetical protein